MKLITSPFISGWVKMHKTLKNLQRKNSLIRLRSLKTRNENFCRSGTKTVATTELDPTGKAANEPGAKLDAGKSPLYRGFFNYFPRAIRAVADVSAFGAAKYSWGGWRSVPDGYTRYSDALVRHIDDEAAGEFLDRDSKLFHAAHAAWNALARLELMLEELEQNNA